VYDRAIGAALRQLYSEGVRHVIFGDLFLSDVRTYREERLAGTGLAPEFPLWGRPTAALARTMLERGVHATAVCVDPRRLPRSFAGREFDQAFLDDLPPGADPCGENGEFHTFVHDAPSFGAPVGFRRGEVVERDGFVFADLLFDASPNPISVRNA
jgi:diphthamide synthase (EF-2-diphthine--ammonia ligase)